MASCCLGSLTGRVKILEVWKEGYYSQQAGAKERKHTSRCEHTTHTHTHTQNYLHSFSRGCVNILRFMFMGSYFTHLCRKWGARGLMRICDPPKITLNKIQVREAQRQVLRCPPLGSQYAAVRYTNQHGVGIFSLMFGWCFRGQSGG